MSEASRRQVSLLALADVAAFCARPRLAAIERIAEQMDRCDVDPVVKAKWAIQAKRLRREAIWFMQQWERLVREAGDATQEQQGEG